MSLQVLFIFLGIITVVFLGMLVLAAFLGPLSDHNFEEYIDDKHD